MFTELNWKLCSPNETYMITTKTANIRRQIVEKTKISFIDFSIVRKRMPKLGKISEATSSKLSI